MLLSMKDKSFLYHYKALVTAAYDGDTNINDELVEKGLAECREY